jgi:hypothetical protein
MGAADDDVRTGLDRAPDDPVDPLELLLVDDRAEVDLLAIRVAEPQPAGGWARSPGSC